MMFEPPRSKGEWWRAGGIAAAIVLVGVSLVALMRPSRVALDVFLDPSRSVVISVYHDDAESPIVGPVELKPVSPSWKSLRRVLREEQVVRRRDGRGREPILDSWRCEIQVSGPDGPLIVAGPVVLVQVVESDGVVQRMRGGYFRIFDAVERIARDEVERQKSESIPRARDE